MIKMGIGFFLGAVLGAFLTLHYATDSARAQIQSTAQTDISHKTIEMRKKTAEVIAPTTK